MNYPDSTITALIGLAVGDAFGSPFEFHAGAAQLSALSMEQTRYLHGYDDCRIPPRRCRTPGLYTDDTQQSQVLLWIWDQLVAKGKNPKDPDTVGLLFHRVCQKMAQVAVPPRSQSFGVHRGTGRNFRTALFSKVAPDTAGLGAAMRVGPIATLLEPDEVLPWVVGVSRKTTTSPMALAAAVQFAQAANWLSRNKDDMYSGEDVEPDPDVDLSGMTPEFVAAWDQLFRAREVMHLQGEERLLEFAAGSSNKALKEAANGFALTGIPWVLHSVMTATSYSDALLRACSSGGDTDTVAAMAGCLAALRFGRSSIPEWMTEGLVGLEHLEDPSLWHPIHTELDYVYMDVKVMLKAEEQVRTTMASRKK